MLRLPQFGVHSPDSIEGVVTALQQPGARLVAGGTDLLPNLKHRLEYPSVLVSLQCVPSLRTVELDPNVLHIGAGMTLTDVSEHDEVRRLFPSLAKAAGLVASPLIRNMGTLGGNVNLDTRCRYVNQTEFWRSALGGAQGTRGCIKSEGTVCYVVPKGRTCVAAMSSDCVPVLMSLGAQVTLRGPEGSREVAIADYFVADGVRHTTRKKGEVMTRISIPVPTGATRCDYTKWSVRRSIDFPLVSVALRFELDGTGHDARIEAVHLIVGVLGAKPRQVTKLDQVLGRTLNDPELATLVSERAYKQCKPLENVPYEAPYRRDMIRVHTRRLVEAVASPG